jgi:hypothetical protein
MTQAEYDVLTAIEEGASVFRPQDLAPGLGATFERTFEVLLALRGQGWIRMPDGRIARDRAGRIMLAGPCDLTEAGRKALEHDRRLGPRPS